MFIKKQVLEDLTDSVDELLLNRRCDVIRINNLSKNLRWLSSKIDDLQEELSVVPHITVKRAIEALVADTGKKLEFVKGTQSEIVLSVPVEEND